MLRSGGDDVVDVGAEDQALLASAALHLHLDGEKRRVGDVHVHLLRRRDEVVLAVGILAQDAGEQLDQWHAADRSAG